ncbi:MAG: hypothetical protein FJ144_08900 [Deltaproteobacteria bacterium]|nr:hypothetical protein [Deltaproteobacteria bacterium]
MIRRRIVRIFRAVSGRALTEVEADNAEAMLDLESENLRQQVARYNEGLALHAGSYERLRRRIAALEREAEDAGRRARDRLAANDREHAGKSALREERLRSELERERESLVEAERAYHELVRARHLAVQAARDKIEGLRRTIGHTRMQTALADLTEMAASLQSTIGIGDADLDRLRETMEERRDLAMGRARVAREALDPDGREEDDAERAAMERMALQRLEERLRAESEARSSAEGAEGSAP